MHRNYAIKNIGHHACLQENVNWSPSRAEVRSIAKSPHFVYVRAPITHCALITRKILPSKDAQRKTEKSPLKLAVSRTTTDIYTLLDGLTYNTSNEQNFRTYFIKLNRIGPLLLHFLVFWPLVFELQPASLSVREWRNLHKQNHSNILRSFSLFS